MLLVFDARPRGGANGSSGNAHKSDSHSLGVGLGGLGNGDGEVRSLRNHNKHLFHYFINLDVLALICQEYNLIGYIS